MKHIKICKPKVFSAKEPVDAVKTNAKKLGSAKTFSPTTEGLGCVPTGNIIDRD